MNDDTYITPNDNLPFPFIDACFYDVKSPTEDVSSISLDERRKNEKLFVSMYNGKETKLITLSYCYQSKQIVNPPHNQYLEEKNGC